MISCTYKKLKKKEEDKGFFSSSSLPLQTLVFGEHHEHIFHNNE